MTSLEFLEKLSGEIWEEHQSEMVANMSGHRWQQTVYTVKRQLTDDEWAKVKEYAQEYIIEPCNAGMGFNFGITFYQAPAFPGLPPQPVFALEGKHFNERFEEAWARLSPLSHNNANAQKLDWAGFDLPKGKTFYEY